MLFSSEQKQRDNIVIGLHWVRAVVIEVSPIAENYEINSIIAGVDANAWKVLKFL